MIRVRKPSPMPKLSVTGILIASMKLYLQFFVYYQVSLLVSFLLLYSQIKKTKPPKNQTNETQTTVPLFVPKN